MAKRMKFSVFGLPHYTIWHLYEPSVDDIRHMEEMEEERKVRERKEQENKERSEAMFKDPKAQWDKDGAAIHEAMTKEQQSSQSPDGENPKTAEEKPAVKLVEESIAKPDGEDLKDAKERPAVKLAEENAAAPDDKGTQ